MDDNGQTSAEFILLFGGIMVVVLGQSHETCQNSPNRNRAQPCGRNDGHASEVPGVL